MMKSALAALALIVPMSAGATTVTLDSQVGGNAGMLTTAADGSVAVQPADAPTAQAVYLDLAAGTYDLTATDGGWNRWSSATGCDGAGTNCATGYEWSFGYFMPDSAQPASATLVNYVGPWSHTFLDSAGSALSTVVGTTVASFTLSTAQRVGFFIYDDYIADNSGSVTFEVTPQIAAVPVPAAGALMLTAFGGLAALRRRARRA